MMFKVGDRVRYKDYDMTGTVCHVTWYATSVQWDDSLITSLFDSELELILDRQVLVIGHDSAMELALADGGRDE